MSKLIFEKPRRTRAEILRDAAGPRRLLEDVERARLESSNEPREKQCVGACRRVLPLSAFAFTGGKSAGRKNKCESCRITEECARRAARPEKWKEYRATQYATNAANIKAAKQKRLAPGTEAHRRALEANRSWCRRLKTRVFTAYGNICECYGESNPALLTVDHVNSDGAEHRKQMKHGKSWTTLYQWAEANHFPPSLRLMCWNCNLGAFRNPGNRGICPHQQELNIVTMALEHQEQQLAA